MTYRPDIEELLGDYIEGTLDPAKRQEVESILSADPELRKSVQRMMLGRDTLKALPIENTPAHVASAIRQAIASPPRRWTLQFSPAKLAAALLLAMTLGVVVWSILPRDQRSPIAANIPARSESLEKQADAEAESRFSEALQPMASAMPAPALQANEPLAAAAGPANPSALMYVRASDIPAVQRQIEQLVGSNRSPEVVSNASPDWVAPAQRGMAKEQGAAGTELMDSAASPAPAARPMAQAEEAKAQKPLALGSKSMADAAFPRKAQIRLNNVSAEQLKQIEQNVVALSPSNQVQIVAAEQDALAPAEQPAAAQSQMQQQMLRSMPSAAPQDLQQFARMRQQADLREEEMQRAQTRYDLTIILEPQPLPAAAPPATFPATAPKTAPPTP